MPPSELLTSLLKGNPPRHAKMVLARGAAPLAAEEITILLVHLARDADAEVAEEAVKSIGRISEEGILAQLREPNCSDSVLAFFAESSNSNPVLETIILNQATPAALIEPLAKRVPESLMEIILYNRVRILEKPGILENLRSNPAMTPAIDRLIREIESEFFKGKKKEYSVAKAGAESAGTEIAETDEASTTEAEESTDSGSLPEMELPPDDLLLEGLPLDPQEREMALAERLSRMTVPQRMRYAMQGNREARAVLIRDTNKEVSRAVLKSPKLSDSEVQAFAAMRNINDDLLRQIGDGRQWTRNYAVVQNLVKNPKTPPLTSQRLIGRLLSRDLAMLEKDRAVPEAVRNTARRMMAQRNAKGKPS